MKTTKSPKKNRGLAFLILLKEMLVKDDLLTRVMIFNTGVIIIAIPILSAYFGIIAKDSDPVFYIALILLTLLGLFLLYTPVWGSNRLLEKAADWANSGELGLFLGLITLSIPITILIRLFQGIKQDR